MLSITTQILLAEHLRLISECELEVELIREVLTEQKAFDPALAFQNLTHSRTFKTPLSRENLQDFFASNATPCKSKALARLIHCYDSDGDLCLSFQDFLNFILPSNSAALRNISSYQDSSIFEPGFLNYELTWALLRVFEKEMQNNKRIKISLKELRSRYDFNIPDAFSTIDLQGLGYLDADAVYNFFVKNKLKISDNEILFLFRKFDKDQDGKISFKEFENEINMLGINKTANRSIFGSGSASKFKSPNKSSNHGSAIKSSSQKNLKKTPSATLQKTPESYNSIKNKKYIENSINSIKEGLQKSRREEPIEEHTGRPTDSPERVSVSKRRLYKNYQFNQEDSDEKLNRESPIRELEERIHKQENLQKETMVNNSMSKSNMITGNFGSNIKSVKESFSEVKEFQGTFGSNVKRNLRTFESPNPSAERKKNLALNEMDEKELVRTLKMQIDLDREIESTKNDLALQNDFSLLEAFRQFDIKGNGSLSLYDLNKAFANLDIHLSEDEAFVFLKRFDKTGENLLRYSDFCDIFIPRSEEYHHILASRAPKKEIGFCEHTKRLIQKIVLQILETEKTCNALKKKLAQRESFTIQDAFTVLDRDQNGYISIDEFRAILNDYNIIPTTSDLINLMKRYDKNRDGKVTFSEFLSELTPKKNY